MTESALFIGVVSHEGSRFAVSQGPKGLAARLAVALPRVEVAVNIVDLLPAQSDWVGPKQVQASLTAERAVDRRWASFLGRTSSPRWWGVYGARGLRRAWQRLQPPGDGVLRRLINIELSHLDLMRRGLASGAPWVLILEDDAFTSDISDLSGGLTALLAQPEGPAYVNLSESFTPDELGIARLLSPARIGWQGTADRTVLTAERPVTNTVCAILYSSAFLQDLVAQLDALPMEPVVPIDWKLNEALMRLYAAGTIRAGDCWLVEPGPIAQMSMQPTAILPT